MSFRLVYGFLCCAKALEFTIAKTRKQPKCPSTEEWIKKMWYIYTTEYYSDIKGNEIELFVVRWIDLESVIQSEVSQIGRAHV